MKVLVVDDESPARARLCQMLDAMQEVYIVEEAVTGRQALLKCFESTPDVVLMDIRMPDMDGLEVARHLMSQSSQAHIPAVIFTTAYNEHALAAFEAQAVDYLLKPIRMERLQQALSKTTQLNRAQLQAVMAHPERTETTERSHLCIRQSGGVVLVPLNDVCCFQADQKYVSAWANGQEYLIDESLKSLEQEFEPQFIRIHRNALVSRQHITGIHKMGNSSYVVTIEGTDRKLDISRRHLATVRKVLKHPPR